VRAHSKGYGQHRDALRVPAAVPIDALGEDPNKLLAAARQAQMVTM
jgi:hypothetical protein